MQIGPRIRVGGTLGKIGQGIKTGAGQVLSNPITKLGVGALLGPLGAAGAGALGGALSGGGVGGTLMGGATGYGLGQVGSLAGNVVRGGIAGAGKGGGMAGAMKGAGAAAGGLGGALKGALGVGPNGQPGWGSTLISTLGGVAGGVMDARENAATLAERQREFDQQQALEQSKFGLSKSQSDYAMQNDQAAAPLRLALIQALMGRLGARGMA